jgi:capsular polysaccharide biosynthesis protein
MMVGITLAFLLEHLDDRWRSPEDAEQVSGVPTFGVVRTFNVPKARKGGI